MAKRREKMICSKCYEVVDDNAVICPHCGCVPHDEDTIQVIPDKTNKALAFLSFVLSALIPEGVIFGFLLWAAKTDIQPKSAKVYGICAILPWFLRWFIPKVIDIITVAIVVLCLLLVLIAVGIAAVLAFTGVITIPGLTL